MFHVMQQNVRYVRARTSVSGGRKMKRYRPKKIAEFCTLREAEEFCRSVPNTCIAYSAEAVKAYNEERAA